MRGYQQGYFIQDDSLQGAGIKFSEKEFLDLWKAYNYEFLVIFPEEKVGKVKSILGKLEKSDQAWQNAKKQAKENINKNPNDFYSGFNLSVALYYNKEYMNSLKTFEKYKEKLPKRHLWYQIEPILAYYKIGEYQKALDLIDQIVTEGNKAFSEIYIVRGDIFLNQGKTEMAKKEYQKALIYNKNLNTAKSRLQQLTTD